MTSYNQYRDKIIDKLIGRGFKTTPSIKLAFRIVKEIRATTGTWTNPQVQAGFYTSKSKTLRDFIDVISDSTFNISNSALQRLVRKFKTKNAIRAVNTYIELVKNKKLLKQKISLTYEEINNGLEVGEVALENLASNLEGKKETLENFRSELSRFSLSGMFKKLSGLMLAFGGILSVFGENEAVVGPIPLGGFGIDSPTSIQEIEVAHSDKMVKYRAVGSIFLAHQMGGKDSIKITGKLTGTGRYIWLSILWILTMISKGQVRSFDWDDKFVNLVGSNEDFGFMRGGGTALSKLEKVDGVITQKPSYIKHITFPVVLTHEIITNCYIETFSFEETLVGLKDVINYDLLLRTYDEPTEFIADEENTMFKAKNKSKTADVLNYALNFMWRLMKQAKETFIDTSSWKLRGYYDIDPLDMGMAFALGFLGGI